MMGHILFDESKQRTIGKFSLKIGLGPVLLVPRANQNMHGGLL